MRQALVYLGAGLLGGFAVSAWWSGSPIDAAHDADVDAHAAGDDSVERIAALARTLTAQVASLESELRTLRGDVDRLYEVREITSEDPIAASPNEPSRAADSPVNAELAGPRERRFRARTPEARIEALIEAGFAFDRAQHIERRVEELRLEAMQARYEAARRGESASAPGQQDFDVFATLRGELGDAEYERYLDAIGQSIAVDVFSVLASSAAEQAGIEPGDQLVAYGGQRIFDVRELNRAVLEGQPGEPVVVEVVRDGQPFQLVLPRGPLGISGGMRRGPGR